MAAFNDLFDLVKVKADYNCITLKFQNKDLEETYQKDFYTTFNQVAKFHLLEILIFSALFVLV